MQNWTVSRRRRMQTCVLNHTACCQIPDLSLMLYISVQDATTFGVRLAITAVDFVQAPPTGCFAMVCCKRAMPRIGDIYRLVSPSLSLPGVLQRVLQKDVPMGNTFGIADVTQWRGHVFLVTMRGVQSGNTAVARVRAPITAIVAAVCACIVPCVCY